jgi:hypothetical protein
MASPTFLCSCENWVTKQKDMDRICAAEMEFLHKVKDCTKLNSIHNERINKLQILFLDEKIWDY